MSNKSTNAVKALVEAQKTFDKAVEALHKKNWASAQQDFEKVVAAQPGTGLAERSRRYISVCADRRAKPSNDADTYLLAVVAKNRGDFEAAMEACTKGGMKGRDERFAFLAAALESLQERGEEASKQLAKAIELNPANRVHAYHDPDFAFLREDPELATIFAAE